MKDKIFTRIIVGVLILGLLLLAVGLLNNACSSSDSDTYHNPSSPGNTERAIDNVVRKSNQKDKQPRQR